jgi:hypothetical protein
MQIWVYNQHIWRQCNLRLNNESVTKVNKNPLSKLRLLWLVWVNWMSDQFMKIMSINELTLKES